jgi:DNA polymerase I-like protein with 3'-5' exonuclease and polymerase domains
MGAAATLVVPLEVDVKVGDNWGEMSLVPATAGV